jgi:hypothetical protein
VKEKCSFFLTFCDNRVLTVGLYVTRARARTHTHTHVYNTYTVEIAETKCKHQQVEMNRHHILILVRHQYV